MFEDMVCIVHFILHVNFITYSVRNAEVLNPANKLEIQFYVSLRVNGQDSEGGS